MNDHDSVACFVCERKIDPQTANAVYRDWGIRYYCDNPECQEAFITDAGERPEVD